VVAGLLWAAWPAAVLASTALQTESVAVPVLLTGLLMLASSGNHHGLLVHIGAGLALGLAALCRANLVLVVPGALLWLFMSYRRHSQRALVAATVVGGVALLTAVPWLLRNYSRLGVVALATQREPLFLGNNAWARGSYDGEFFAPYAGRQERWLEARHPGFRMKPEVEKSRIYAIEAVTYWRESPNAASG